MNQEDRTKVVTNYYKASNALMEIGTIENIPEELKQLAINASSATMKIIDYINSQKNSDSLYRPSDKWNHRYGTLEPYV